jgi:hypothetical protein
VSFKRQAEVCHMSIDIINYAILNIYRYANEGQE